MDQQYPIVAKIPILDTGKFEQWQFRIQQYLQHEHYALWEVIEFGDSYEDPASTASTTTTDTTSGETGKKSRRTVTLTAEDMQKKKNDVKARTTLLLSLPDENQLRFSKYKTTRELWAAILKTFSGNEATKKTKKNLLKQQHGNFKAEGSKTLEQTFNRLQVIVGQLQFMDVEVEHDDLNQKFLTSLAPEWLMHTIVWINRSDLDTMSLDDLYNHLKVYESVQKKSEPNSQNMAFISSAKHSSGNEDVNTACVPTASINVPTASASVATISQDTACAYIASQSSGSQIKFEDINQINKDDIEEMDIKWNMALLSMRADKFWKKTVKKISIQGSDVAGQGSKAEKQAPKALMAIDGVGWDWSYLENDEEDHALVANEVAPIEFALMANTSAECKVFDNSLYLKDCKKNNDSLNSKINDLTDKLFDAKNMIYHYKLRLAQVESRLVEYKEREVKYCEKIRTLEFRTESNNECIEILKKKLETLKQEKEGVDGKLAGLLTASKDLNNLIKSQRADKNKEGLGYSAIPPPPAQIYSSPKKDLSWTGLPEFVDDTVTDYSRPSPTMESTYGDDQNGNPSVFETIASPITPKPFIKFVKPKYSQSKSKTNETETPKKPPVKYAEQYEKPNKKPNVRGNQRNWNNLKSHQLGPDFVMKKKACFNCGDFNHLGYDCRKRVKKSFTPKPIAHKPYKPPVRPVRTNMNGTRPNRTTFNKQAHSYANKPFHRTSSVRSHYRALWVPTVNRNFPHVNRKFSTGRRNFPTANRKFPTATRKFPAGSTKCSTTDMGMKGKVVKPSAYWFWKPSQNLSNKGPNNNNVSVMFKKYTYIDTQGRLNGCSRHMTGNISYLSDYEPFDGGYVSFGQGGCKITGKGTIKTGKLEFENVYFVKDLKTSRQHNMYSIDLNNIVPHRDLTCLVAKASAAECTKDATSQEVKKDVSSLRYIALPNWAHDALLESSSSKPQDRCITEVPEGSGNPNPTASTSNPPANLIEILTVESPIPIVSSPVLTIYSTDSQEPSSDAILISKRVANQEETPSLDNILSLTNQFEDILRVTTNSDESNGVEADISNMETAITASPTPTLKIHKDHPKSQIIGPLDTLIQTRNKSKEDSEFPAKVYKVEKAMYGLHQAPRAWYDTLSKYLLKNGFQKGTIDQTLFIRRQREDLILVQVYVDDIIFGSLNLQLYREFEALMHEKFQISVMGELNFFLGLQVLQKEDGIFLSQDKHQVTPKECHMHAVKRIFRYLKVHPKLGLWYPKESPFYLVAYSDSDYGGATQDCKSTTGGYALTFKPTVYVSHIRQFWSTARIETTEEGTKILATVDGFNDSNIAIALVCLATNRTYNFSKMIFDGLVKNVNNKGEGLGTPTKPYHTPSPEAQPPSHTTHSSSTLLFVTTTSIPTVTPYDTTPIRQYTRRARIAQSSALSTIADKPESPLRDISQGEACPTDYGFIADQDRATIAKSSTLPHDSAPRVTSPAADEGSMQQTINELTALCTSLQRQYSELAGKFEAQEIEITRLKARVKLLEDRQGVAAEGSGDDAPIKGRNLDEGETAAERASDDTEEMATVLMSMDATTVLASRAAEVPTGSGSIPTAGPPAVEVPNGSDVVPTASSVFATTTVVTPYKRRKGKEVMIAKDAEIARIHAEEELQIMIDGLDRNNETIAKYLQEYHQFASELPIERRIELISDLVKSNLGWRVKDFRGMTFEEVEAKFNSVWKQMEDFIPMGSKEEPERIKRKGLSLEQEKWKLYDLCGVHHVTSKDKEIFMLVEKDYPLRKVLALVMICYKLQVENYLQMANDLILKIYKIANSPGQQGIKCTKAFPLPGIEFPLTEEVPTASEEGCHYQKKREATTRKIALLSKSRRNCQSKSNDSFTKLVPHVTPCILGITIIVTSCTRTPFPIKGVL
nr:putative ribonuclease H-like domain-containing protein [Tanacetum cinerariifolium]